MKCKETNEKSIKNKQNRTFHNKLIRLDIATPHQFHFHLIIAENVRSHAIELQFKI